MSLRVGIDIGGTFTDIVLLAGDGRTLTIKVPSTPDDYSRGIAEGLAQAMAAHAMAGSDFREVVHGTTVATNAILEKRGVRTGLITTEGFRDVLEIRRLRMPRLYDLTWEKPKALAARNDRVEVSERIDHRGRVLRPLDPASVDAAVDKLLGNGVEAVAVALINAYANGAHEQAVAERLRARAPELPLCLSSEILPEIKEYERTSTVVVNAYILPVVSRYLRALAAALAGLGIEAPLRIMQSNGGAMGAEAAAARPIHIIESGPAAGVVGAAEIAAKLGYADVLTFDMGGTTAKAAMIEDGRFDRVGELDVGAGINYAARLLKGGGYHVSVPAIDIAEVGAGGGSLVRIDAGGALAVGPDSAGAVPGPVCYGQGNDTPTVTDANVVLGFVNPEYLVGGELKIDAAAAAEAIRRQIAGPLGVDTDEAAFGVHRVANAVMARALRAVSSERGRDPRRFALMAFGGNGPVHAATLARLLDISTILVPPVAGVFSALGLLFPASEHHYVRTFKHDLETLTAKDVDAGYRALAEDGIRELQGEGYAPDRIEIERHADLRYRGENTSLTVPAPAKGDLVAVLDAAFAEEHERTYGYRSDEEVVELVNLRLIARGCAAEARVPTGLTVESRAEARVGVRRRVYFGPAQGRLETPVVARAEIGRAPRLGPLIVEEYDSTTVVPPGCTVRRVDWDTLLIEVGAEPA
jgi:N-methylhydantoinase A